MLAPKEFFDLEKNPFKELFADTRHVWEPLANLGEYIQKTINPNVAAIRQGSSCLNKTVVLFEGKVIDEGFVIETPKKGVVVRKDSEVLPGASIIYAGTSLMDDEISIGKNTVIEPGALIKGPTVIGDNTEVRQGAYIRGNVLIGDNCVVGHTTEMKSSVMLGGSKAGHFAYIGDSILGEVNLGAGTKLANLKMIPSQIVLRIKGKEYETGLRKFGAILADGVETGCNSVTSPGTIMGKNTILYPNATARGYYAPDTLIKVRQTHETETRK